MSLSVITFWGIPKWGKTLWAYNAATPSASICSLHGRKSAALEHPWSVIVRIVSYPLLQGSLVIKSIATVSNGSVFGLLVIG